MSYTVPNGHLWRVTNKEGAIVNPGDTVTDFRGETATYQGVARGPEPERMAKVIVDGREYYASVFDLTVTDDDGSTPCTPDTIPDEVVPGATRPIPTPWGMLIDRDTQEPIGPASEAQYRASMDSPMGEILTVDSRIAYVAGGPEILHCGHTADEHINRVSDGVEWAGNLIADIVPLNSHEEIKALIESDRTANLSIWQAIGVVVVGSSILYAAGHRHDAVFAASLASHAPAGAAPLAGYLRSLETDEEMPLEVLWSPADLTPREVKIVAIQVAGVAQKNGVTPDQVRGMVSESVGGISRG